jgi:NADH-quinone oxidoreductase subunit I
MVVRVVRVRRRERLGWLERAWLPMIARALRITARHFFRNLRAGGRSDFVVAYPEERIDPPAAFRGMPVLVAQDDGRPLCVACGLCEFACPTDCIAVVAGELDGAGIERQPEQFDIDMSRCMFCGLCEEACPEEAIVMSHHVELASYDRAAMLHHKEDLLVHASELKRRIDFLRAEYDRDAGEDGA